MGFISAESRVPVSPGKPRIVVNLKLAVEVSQLGWTFPIVLIVLEEFFEPDVHFLAGERVGVQLLDQL